MEVTYQCLIGPDWYTHEIKREKNEVDKILILFLKNQTKKEPDPRIRIRIRRIWIRTKIKIRATDPQHC